MSEEAKTRQQELVERYGEDDVFTKEQLQELFDVEGFGGGIVVVRRKADGARGSLDFDHMPRYYYRFVKA